MLSPRPEPAILVAGQWPRLIDWVVRRRPYLKANLPLDFESHEYLRGIYADEWPRMVITKAAQTGISEYLISWILWSADERHATGLYVMPTDTHVSDFSAARLGPALEPKVSPYLASRVVSGDDRGADRVGLKRIGDRFIYFRGAKIGPDDRAAQLKSIDADVFVRDEVDEMDPRVKPIVDERIGASSLAEWRAASTPTYAGRGIHAEYQESTRHQWFVPCPSCGEKQPLELAGLVNQWDELDRPTHWNHDGDGLPFIACRACGSALNRLAAGEWVPEFPGREVHGYQVPGLAAGRKRLSDIIESLKSTDETTRRQAWNQKLGLPYKSSLAQSMSEAVLDACRREYKPGLVPGEALYAGIDVGRVLNMTVRAKLPNGDRPLRLARQLSSFDEAAKIIREWKVRGVVIDALPETRKSRELQRDFPRLRIWVAYYSNSKVGLKDAKPADWDARQLEVSIDRTRALDVMYAKFYEASLGEPGCTLPTNARYLADYYAQMMAPERKLVKDAMGNEVATYVEATPDHYAHAESYCLQAMECPYAGWARGAEQ